MVPRHQNALCPSAARQRALNPRRSPLTKRVSFAAQLGLVREAMAGLAADAVRLARTLQGAVLQAAEQLAPDEGQREDADALLAPRLAALRELLAQPGAAAAIDVDLGSGAANAEKASVLLTAIRKNDLPATLLLLRSRPLRAPEVGAPLAVALALPSRRDWVPALLVAGCKPWARDGRGANALHAAVRARVALPVLRSLMEACPPASLSDVDAAGATPLLAAMWLTDPAPTRELLETLLRAPGGGAGAALGRHNTLVHAPDAAFVLELVAAGVRADNEESTGLPLSKQLVLGAPPGLVQALFAAGASTALPWLSHARQPRLRWRTRCAACATGLRLPVTAMTWQRLTARR